MPTIKELLGMTSKEVYGEAVRAGIEVVTKRVSLGIEGPEAWDKWYEEHPEFASREVKERVVTGARLDLLEVLEEVREIPNVCCVVNATGDVRKPHEVFRTERKKRR